MFKFVNKDFDYFKERCWYWYDYFNLYDWHMSVHFEDSLTERGAQCRTMSSTHEAQIVLFAGVETITEDDIKDYLNKTALHEIAHVMTADYNSVIDDRLEPDLEKRISETFAIRLTNAMIKSQVTKEK